MPASGTPMAETVIAAGSGAVSGAASGSGLEEPKRSRKPANTKFKQQQLPAWQPMLTARSVLPFLVAIGVAFIPIGIALYLSASNVTEISIEYTNCRQINFANENASCANVTGKCNCREPFTLSQNVSGPVYMYYALDNFFQNHRKYVKSRDDSQLMGAFEPYNKEKEVPSKDCAPFNNANESWGYAPCGAIANSLFNDTINLTFLDKNSSKKVDLLRTNIAWKSDKDVKFRNPTGDLKDVCTKMKLAKPAFWTKNLWELDEDPNNNGLKNEDLIVWMRTAAFPSFRKLYRRINHTDVFVDGLPAGNYVLDIEYNYPVTQFDGRKYVIFSSVSWIGGRNPFLGIAYMTVGCACLLLAAIFFFIHVRWGKNLNGMNAFNGLTVATPFARSNLRSFFLETETTSSTPDTSSRNPLSSGRWLDTIPSMNETEESQSDSHGTTTDSTRKTVHSTGSQHDAASPRLMEVNVVSSLAGLKTGQTIHELLNDMLANVTVVNASDLTAQKSMPELNEYDVRMRRRQMLEQPVLVD